MLGVVLSSQARGEIVPFAELWNNVAYYDTNNERKGFSSILAHLEGKIGVQPLDSVPLQIYGAYYGVLSQSPDYWDNAVYSGPGVRLKPFASYQPTGWQNEWLPDLKVYYETLSATYFKNEAAGNANKRTDTRYGLDLWHEWNLDEPNFAVPWGELWANLSYRTTNFSWTDFNSYILYFQPKLGHHWGQGLETYLKQRKKKKDA